MENLPKDIFKLILFYYLSPFDAINLICINTTFYNKYQNNICLLKRNCYAEMNKIVGSFGKKLKKKTRLQVFPGQDTICICGVLLKGKNLYRHNKKCHMQRMFPQVTMKDDCEYCGLKLLSWNYDIYGNYYVTYHNGFDHMSYCAGIHKVTRSLYWKNEKHKHIKTYRAIIYEYMCYLYEKFTSVYA